VVYREAAQLGLALGRRRPVLPVCETSLVWPAGAVSPALARFVEFVRARVATAA
jgi:hypothetical protein